MYMIGFYLSKEVANHKKGYSIYHMLRNFEHKMEHNAETIFQGLLCPKAKRIMKNIYKFNSKVHSLKAEHLTCSIFPPQIYFTQSDHKMKVKQ